MSYIPLSVINAAIGSEAAAFKTIAEIVAALTLDKTVLADTLNDKGVAASPSESLIDLINKVVPLQVNFNLPFTEDFRTDPFPVDSITDSVSAPLFDSLFSNGNSESIGNVNQLPNQNGEIWLTEKWNAVLIGNNDPVQYVASASTEEPGFEAYKAFDNTNATLNDTWLTVTGNVTGYLQYQDTGGGAVVTEYKITSRNAASGGIESPRSWTFEGSNNGTTWVVLDTRVNISFDNNETKIFYFSNATSYSYYKLNVTLNNGSVNFVAVGELEIRQNPGGTIIF
jgi:hypothetical protein